MAARELIAESLTPDGEALALLLEGADHVVRVRGELLMSSRQCGSEQAMATIGLEHCRNAARPNVLVAGLGMGFTLRAVLDALPGDAGITVIELFEDVVHWNRGPLAGYAGRALDDPRVEVVVGDLGVYLRGQTQRFDAILVDVDNGPEAFTVDSNDVLYAPEGLDAFYQALAPGGLMVLWSAFRSRDFEQRLRRAGFDARSVPVRARGTVRKGSRHTLFVGARGSHD